MTDLEPTTPQEYILKGVVNAVLGQEQGIVCRVLTYMLLYSLCFCIVDTAGYLLNICLSGCAIHLLNCY